MTEYSTSTLDDLSLVNCSAAIGGGGFIASVNATATLSQMLVTNCSMEINAEGGAGGMIQGYSQVKITHSNFTQNHVSLEYGQGGALLAVDSTSVTVENSLFDGNRAAEGGAISLSYSSRMILTNAVLQNNSANLLAGAIYADRLAYLFINEGTFQHNRVARGGGGAVGIKDSSTLDVQGSYFMVGLLRTFFLNPTNSIFDI